MRWLGAVQSQDYGSVKWSVGHCTVGVDDAAVDRLFADWVILCTHVIRPTWHFVLRKDIRRLLALAGPRAQVTNAHRYRQLQLDDAVLTRSRRRIARPTRPRHSTVRRG